MPLGWLATAIGIFVLWALQRFEKMMSVEQNASLVVTLDQAGPSNEEIRRWLEAAAIRVRDVNLQSGPGSRTLTLNVIEVRRRSEPSIPPVVEQLSRRAGVAALEWRCLD